MLKLPHHGSSRDVAKDYFTKIRATHYVISADGKYDNPDLQTLQWLSEARPDDQFTVYLTYPFDEFEVPAIGKKLKTFFDNEKKSGRKYKVVTRPSSAASLMVQP